jgi:pyruvate,orthophosphate dikinase
VFRSWDGDRARAYRRREGIADDLGTGVTIQAMVFGNRGDRSATGVAFTRDPATGAAGLYGDVMFGAQGEDVVAGTHATKPLAVLDERLPDAAADLRRSAALLERHYRDLCDIEFTVEEGRLWMLQVRVGKRSPRAALRIALEMAEDPTFPLTRGEAVERVRPLLADPPRMAAATPPSAERLAVGLPASPGVASGEIATTPEAAQAAADAGRTPILVRNETSPDDVHGMARSAGIVTATGGLASHAAVVARGWGIPAVVGAVDVRIVDDEVVFPGGTLHAGDAITVDGDTGSVYRGAVSGPSGVVPEVATLVVWAKDLGVPIGHEPEPIPPTLTCVPAPVAADACLHALGIKGFAAADAIAQALLADAPAIAPLLDELVAAGLVATTPGAYRLTDAGRARDAELLALERAVVGPEAAEAALDAFLDIDRRVKAVVSDWQLRSDHGATAINDHADAAYDAAVLGRLTAVHADVVAWIGALAGAWTRVGAYRVRLDAALERAAAGDGRYVASPRVDSYHGAWFELHEDLIRLAGRTREGEVAAGRA